MPLSPRLLLLKSFVPLIVTRLKTYELVTGRSPFEAGMNDTALIPQFETVVGGVPDQWVSEAVSKGILLEDFNGMYVGTLRALSDD